MTLCIIGGDERMTLLPHFLTQKCISAQLKIESTDDVYCYLADLISHCDAVILPVPITRDGKTLNSPNINADISLGRLLDICANQSKPVLGGCVADKIINQYTNIYDYAKSQRFSVRNARLTAEGTLAKMIEKSSGTLYGSKVLIVGGGRIANALVPLIMPFTDDITVAARRDEVRQEFINKGCKAADTANLSLVGFDYIVNTVPYLLIDENILKSAKQNALIFDLATSPSGVDIKAAERLNIKTYLLPGVPGKCSPLAAAKVIADEIETILRGIDLS